MDAVWREQRVGPAGDPLAWIPPGVLRDQSSGRRTVLLSFRRASRVTSP